MEYEFLYSEDVLVIKLSGTAGVNERLLVKEVLLPHLQHSNQKVVVDMEGVEDSEGAYLIGVLNTIRKEFQLLNGEVKLRSLKPALRQYFLENRLDDIFAIGHSPDEVKSSYRK